MGCCRWLVGLVVGLVLGCGCGLCIFFWELGEKCWGVENGVVVWWVCLVVSW